MGFGGGAEIFVGFGGGPKILELDPSPMDVTAPLTIYVGTPLPPPHC